MPDQHHPAWGTVSSDFWDSATQPRPIHETPSVAAPEAEPAPAAPSPPSQAPPGDSPEMAAWRQTAIQQAEHFLTRAEDPSQRGRWQRIHHELSSSPAPWAAATELWMDIAAALLWSGAPQEEVASVLRDAHRLWQAAGDPRQAVMAPWLLHLLQQVSAVSDLAESTRQWIAEHQQEAA